MSASEKLKALEQRRATASSRGDDWVFDPQAHHTVASVLSSALPQIVAVVEIAERRTDFAMNDREQEAAITDTLAALAALDEQLQDLGSATESETPTPR